MKIYTKKGDKGKTSLIGGKTVDKHDSAVDSYGTIDELNSFVGLLNDYVKDKGGLSYTARDLRGCDGVQGMKVVLNAINF